MQKLEFQYRPNQKYSLDYDQSLLVISVNKVTLP
jgi:hypothetical protein